MKDHTLGEKLALICMEICRTHAHVLIMVSDLIHMQAWISQWLGFASQGLTRGKWRLAGFGRESPLFAESLGILWRLWILESFLCSSLKVDGRWNKFIYWLFYSSTKSAFYLYLHELTDLHSCDVLFLFSFIFLGYLTVQSPKSNTLLSPFRLRGMVIPIPCAGMMGMTLERVTTVWISDTSLGWSLYPWRCSQLHAGSPSCVSWDLFCNSAFSSRVLAVLLSSVQDMPSPH